MLNKRGHERRIPASVKPPDRANISQITLRSGRGYEGPVMRKDENTPLLTSKEGKIPNLEGPEVSNDRVEDGL